MSPTVLFDLDGTLADSAPDLAGALNRLLAEHGKAPVDLHVARRLASSGARGLIKAGFGLTPQDEPYAALQSRFLDLYAQAVCVHTRLFPEVEALLDRLDALGLRWGIVTNKATRFTVPLVDALGLTPRAACVVCGDTTARAKPAPDPLLHAASQIGVPPDTCWYVGDDLRDIQAARAASMPVLAATYGYLGDGETPDQWGADGLIASPLEVLNYLR